MSVTRAVLPSKEKRQIKRDAKRILEVSSDRSTVRSSPNSVPGIIVHVQVWVRKAASCKVVGEGKISNLQVGSSSQLALPSMSIV